MASATERRACICAAAYVTLALGVSGGVQALGVGIASRDVQRAITLAGRAQAERDRFHRRYVVATSDPTVEVEVISEFRRVVLAAEERIRIGDRSFGVRDAEAALKPWRGRVTLVARLRFHPQNTFAQVPACEIALAGQPELRPLDLRRAPVYAAAGRGGFIAGATVEGVFDAAPLARATRRVIVRLESKDLAAAAIDFTAIE